MSDRPMQCRCTYVKQGDKFRQVAVVDQHTSYLCSSRDGRLWDEVQPPCYVDEFVGTSENGTMTWKGLRRKFPDRVERGYWDKLTVGTSHGGGRDDH